MTNTFTLKIRDEKIKDFKTFDKLYAYMDFQVSVQDLDECRLEVNGKKVNGTITDIANKKSYRHYLKR